MLPRSSAVFMSFSGGRGPKGGLVRWVSNRLGCLRGCGIMFYFIFVCVYRILYFLLTIAGQLRSWVSTTSDADQVWLLDHKCLWFCDIILFFIYIFCLPAFGWVLWLACQMLLLLFCFTLSSRGCHVFEVLIRPWVMCRPRGLSSGLWFPSHHHYKM